MSNHPDIQRDETSYNPDDLDEEIPPLGIWRDELGSDGPLTRDMPSGCEYAVMVYRNGESYSYWVRDSKSEYAAEGHGFQTLGEGAKASDAAARRVWGCAP